jgi:transposase
MYISRVVSCNLIPKCLEKKETTEILRQLIVRSALPLRSIETVFAPDSTGFGTSRFEKWYDEKYGVTRRQCTWIKTHAIAGVKTGICTAVVILDRNAGDSPQLPELLHTTAEIFTIKEVPADKGYLSYDNLDLVESLGGVAYIPFKSNSVLGGTPLWNRMFHFFNLHREEFLKKYHPRSNVESVFSAIKRKFGDSVRSKIEPATVNEVLCKVLCHNIGCVIHSWYELGIDPTDWGMKKPEGEPAAGPAEPEDLPAVLRFPRAG